MKFGYVLPNFGGRIGAAELLEISEVCEEEGFDSVWATDHVIMPTELREPYGEVLEPLVTLSFIASRTEKLRVGTSILILPQRNPIVVAKQAAAIDVYSGGRMILGFGAGWAEKEYGYLNAEFRRRGRVYDEQVKLMRALWSEEVVDFDGEFYHVKDALFLPKPVNGGIPIWFGGNGPPSVKRAIRLGDGWHPVGLSVEDLAKGVKAIVESGRDLTISMRMTTDVRKRREPTTDPGGERRLAVSGTASEMRASIGVYEKAGLQYYCAAINHPKAEEIVADLRKFAAEVVRSY